MTNCHAPLESVFSHLWYAKTPSSLFSTQCNAVTLRWKLPPYQFVRDRLSLIPRPQIGSGNSKESCAKQQFASHRPRCQRGLAYRPFTLRTKQCAYSLRHESLYQDAAAVAAPLRNANKPSLICSALVGGMPCGKPSSTPSLPSAQNAPYYSVTLGLFPALSLRNV